MRQDTTWKGRISMLPHDGIPQIRIGTCIPGWFAEKWAAPMMALGYETLSINFHMEYRDIDIARQGPRIKALADGKGVEITTLGYYCNALESEDHLRNLERAIDCAHLYGAKIVSTFAGAFEGKSVDEALPRFGVVFRELARRAEDRGVRLAIENCPMGGTWDRATCNIGFNPRAWERMFDEVKSDALGLEWEPAHQMIQLIDPIAQLRKWVKKVYHLHGKDATIDRRAIEDYGVLCDTDRYAPERTPGFGDCDWRDIISILRIGGYAGDICVEGYHDPIYRDDWEMTAQKHALGYLKWCRGGEFTPNPW